MFASGDLQHGALLILAICCAVVVVAGAGWRLVAGSRDVPRAERVALQLSAAGKQREGTTIR